MTAALGMTGLPAGQAAEPAAPPPTDWIQPDFADHAWSRYSLNPTRAREQDYGFAPAWGAPGPSGAVRTERFEQVRQGLQECQARIFIERAILTWYEGAGSAGMAEKLFAAAA